MYAFFFFLKKSILLKKKNLFIMLISYGIKRFNKVRHKKEMILSSSFNEDNL